MSTEIQQKKAATYARQAKWRDRNPKAVWAQSALRAAVKRGLIQPQPCEVCGAVEAEGHHRDYDRPADVVWLCRKHHKAEHRRLQQKGNAA
jgi:hypothetical protein